MEWTDKHQAQFEAEERADMEAERAFNAGERQYQAMVGQMERDELRHFSDSPAGILLEYRTIHGGGPGRVGRSEPDLPRLEGND